jgi:hypothetical protein
MGLLESRINPESLAFKVLNPLIVAAVVVPSLMLVFRGVVYVRKNQQSHPHSSANDA